MDSSRSDDIPGVDAAVSELLDGLLQFTIGVLDARTVDEITAVMTRVGAPLIGAANITLAVLDPSGEVLRVHWGPDASAGAESVRRVHLSESTPMTDAVRRDAPVTVRTRAAFEQRYPNIAAHLAPGEMQAIMAFPLHADGTVVGAGAVRFDRPHAVTPVVRATVKRLVPIVEHTLVRVLERHDLEMQRRRLEQSNRDLDAFAAVTAHDLTGPVRRIGSFLQLLLADIGPLSPKAQGYADRILQQTEHLSALLRDTLAYAKAVGPSASRHPVELVELVEQGRASMASELKTATLDVGDLPIVDVEPTLITQVFVDLFENAVKYSRPGVDPKIRVRAEPVAIPVSRDDDRPWWRVTVADNGIGIEPERADEVFGMFARLEISDHRPGTGIGLAFVKRIVEGHGGEIGVADGLDGGASIWFTLPGVQPVDRWA